MRPVGIHVNRSLRNAFTAIYSSLNLPRNNDKTLPTRWQPELTGATKDVSLRTKTCATAISAVATRRGLNISRGSGNLIVTSFRRQGKHGRKKRCTLLKLHLSLRPSLSPSRPHSRRPSRDTSGPPEDSRQLPPVPYLILPGTAVAASVSSRTSSSAFLSAFVLF